MSEIVMVVAKDWAHFAAQLDTDFNFELIVGEVYGLLVREDDEKVIIAHQRFPNEDQVRQVTAIPKANIISMIRLVPVVESQTVDGIASE